MKNEIIFPALATADGIAVVGTVVQTEHILQIISIVITCIAGLFSIILGALVLFSKIKAAMKDGKIDKEEAEEIAKDIDEFSHIFDNKLGKKEDNKDE